MKIGLYILSVGFCCVVSFADTIHVPADYSTIQGAIDSANNGDVVLVSPGTYVENIDFVGKAITVRSSGGAATTFIDGGNPISPYDASTVTFRNGEGPDSVLQGFTITHGTGIQFIFSYGWQWCGGGIFCLESSPTITENIIENNVSNAGAGIYCDTSSLTITNCIISENTPLDDSCYGGGIYCVSSSLTLEGITLYMNIAHNDGVFGGYGGGIYCYSSSMILTDCSINENRAMFSGGGISCSDSTVTITNCSIVGNMSTWRKGGGIDIGSKMSSLTLDNCAVIGNRAYEAGGGVNCRSDASGTIRNNIITGNEVIESSSKGGGICCGLFSSAYTADVMIANNIISGNSAVWKGGGIYCGRESASLTIDNNIITGNTVDQQGGGIYLLGTADPVTTNNTISMNTAVEGGGIFSSATSPVFTNTILWDNMAATGPEIWSGASLDPETLSISYSNVKGGQGSVHVDYNCTLDWGDGMIEANPLFVDASVGDFHLIYDSPCRGTGDNSAVTESYDFEGDSRVAHGTVDMGADEFYNHLYCTGDFTPGGSIEGKFVGLPGTTPVGLFIGSGIIDPPLHHMWGDFYLESPWILIPLIPIPANGVMVIPAAVPATPAPYDIPMQALIGWEFSNLYVLEVR